MQGRNTAFLLALLLLASPALAVNIGVSPGVINFQGMIKNGYAERDVLISTSSPEPLRGHFTASGEIKDWITLSPASNEFNISSEAPYAFKVIVVPPADAKNGNYTGLLTMQTDTLASVTSGAGSSIIAAVALKINVEVTGEERIACTGGAISVTSAEINTPFMVSATVYNEGNVRLRPQVLVEVKDQDQESSLLSTSFLGAEILPTTSKRVSKNIENRLPIGQYFADVTLKECGIKKTISFDIVEKGGIADTGSFIGIKANSFAYINEPNLVVAKFTNTGPREVIAKFKGQITSLPANRIVTPLESEEVSIAPGDLMEFRMFFTPKEAGKYQISGRIIYNKKITFEEQSAVVEAIPREGNALSIGGALMLVLYAIIGLVILILIGKIRKERKRKRF